MVSRCRRVAGRGCRHVRDGLRPEGRISGLRAGLRPDRSVEPQRSRRRRHGDQRRSRCVGDLPNRHCPSGGAGGRRGDRRHAPGAGRALRPRGRHGDCHRSGRGVRADPPGRGAACVAPAADRGGDRRRCGPSAWRTPARGRRDPLAGAPDRRLRADLPAPNPVRITGGQNAPGLGWGEPDAVGSKVGGGRKALSGGSDQRGEKN